jgi:hypothetical protein
MYCDIWYIFLIPQFFETPEDEYSPKVQFVQYSILVRKSGGKRTLGRSWRRWNTLLERIVGRGLDASGSGWGIVAVSFEHGNEPSGTIKGGKFLD